MKINEENTNPVKKRIYILVKMKLMSPALIGSGEDEETDRDVYLDTNNNPLLPGTAIAGVLRGTLNSEEAAELFGMLISGEDDDSKGNMSSLWVYDAPLLDRNKKPAPLIIIDNVALEEGKTAKPTGKFDFQAVDRNAEFNLRMMLVIRKNDKRKELEDLLEKLLSNLNSLYIGGKSSRGFGRLACVGDDTNPSGAYYKMEYDFSEEVINELDFEDRRKLIEKLAAFRWEDLPKTKPKPIPVAPPKDINIIEAGLVLDGTVLVRDKYSVVEDEDHAHTASGGLPVIYATAWVGAIRHGITRFLADTLENADRTKIENLLNEIFGYMDERKDKSTGKRKTKPSAVRVDASYFERMDNRHNVTRVKIDRFTGGASEGALFTVRPQFGGETLLRIAYPKTQEAEKCVYTQFFALILDAIDRGIITVGGETSIGRGVFKLQKERTPMLNNEPLDIRSMKKGELLKCLTK